MVIYIVKDICNIIGYYADEEKACSKAFEINKFRSSPEGDDLKRRFGLAFVYQRPVIE